MSWKYVGSISRKIWVKQRKVLENKGTIRKLDKQREMDKHVCVIMTDHCHITTDKH